MSIQRQASGVRPTVDAGIKRQQFRRFCSSEKPAIGGDAVPTLWQFLNLPPENHAARVRQPPVWSNGDAPTVSDPSSHRSISRGSQFATNPNASGVAAAIITARRSLWIPNTANWPGQPQKWRSRNPDYWRRYREQHPAAVERNRQQQHVRDQKQRLRDLANNNSVFDLKRSAAEIWLLGAGLQNLANNNSAPTQVWILEGLPPRKPPASESCKQQRPGDQAASDG